MISEAATTFVRFLLLFFGGFLFCLFVVFGWGLWSFFAFARASAKYDSMQIGR